MLRFGAGGKSEKSVGADGGGEKNADAGGKGEKNVDATRPPYQTPRSPVSLQIETPPARDTSSRRRPSPPVTLGRSWVSDT